jgi:hypothetical protein
MGRGGISALNLNLSCRWSLAVSFTPRLLYPEESLVYTLNRTQSWCEQLEEETHVLHFPGIRHLSSQLIDELLWNLEQFYAARTPAQNLLYSITLPTYAA